MISRAERKARNELSKKMAEALIKMMEDKVIEKLVGEHGKDLDRWIKKQKKSGLDRFGAVKRLIELGLNV